MKMKLPPRPKSRPDIWRIAMYLHAKFSSEAWAVADTVGWYRAALAVHNEVFRQSSPYLEHPTPPEAWAIEVPPL